METPAQHIEKVLKEWFAKFKKTPFALPVAIALIAGISALVLMFMSNICGANLITPAAMVGILWLFDVKSVKKLLIIGLVAAIPLMLVLAAVVTDDLGDTEPVVSTSKDRELIINGTLEPLFGNEDTIFVFNATVNMQNATYVEEARLIVYNLGMIESEVNNYTMELVSQDNLTAKYTYSTTVSEPLNEYIFAFKIDGLWYRAGYVDNFDNVYLVEGPLSNDPWAIWITLIPRALISTMLNTFIPFAIICAMIWWVRRARRMRAEAIDRLEAEREKKKEELPKDKAKVPSLTSAMGLSKEDMFVCSECGADVPGDAKECPKCGEKFE